MAADLNDQDVRRHLCLERSRAYTEHGSFVFPFFLMTCRERVVGCSSQFLPEKEVWFCGLKNHWNKLGR